MISRIKETFGIQLPLRRIFDLPTVARLSQEIAERKLDQEKAEQAELLAMLETLGDEEAEAELRKRAAQGGSQ